MNILCAISKPLSTMIFAKKTIEMKFRHYLPNKLKIGDKIFIYETKINGGCGKVLGYATVNDIGKFVKKMALRV